MATKAFAVDWERPPLDPLQERHSSFPLMKCACHKRQTSNHSAAQERCVCVCVLVRVTWFVVKFLLTTSLFFSFFHWPHAGGQHWRSHRLFGEGPCRGDQSQNANRVQGCLLRSGGCGRACPTRKPCSRFEELFDTLFWRPASWLQHCTDARNSLRRDSISTL